MEWDAEIPLLYLISFRGEENTRTVINAADFIDEHQLLIYLLYKIYFGITAFQLTDFID